MTKTTKTTKTAAAKTTKKAAVPVCSKCSRANTHGGDCRVASACKSRRRELRRAA